MAAPTEVNRPKGKLSQVCAGVPVPMGETSGRVW